MIDWTDWNPPTYDRHEISYETWYSEWSKKLALLHTRADLQRMLGITDRNAHTASAQHHAAVKATTSMTSQSQRRAQSRNVVAAAGETAMAIRGALDIHVLFPEHAKGDQL